MFEKKRMGDILLERGKLTKEQLITALDEQKKSGKKLGEILIENNIVSEEDVIDVISMQIGIEKVDLTITDFDNRAIKMLSQNLCKKYDFIPFGFNENKIKVALSDPSNIFAIDDISIATGFDVESYISPKWQIRKFIEVYYNNQQIDKAAEELFKETLENKSIEASIEEVNDVKNAPVVKMIEYIFKNSIEMRASDIHIEPYENEIRIRYRIDGQLKLINTLPIENLSPLVARIKILANMNIAEKRIPQDGKIITTVADRDVDLRVSVLPIVNGEKIVIRILDRNSYQIGREKLGMKEEDLKKLDNIISSPNGIVLVTGPTGSGKSTTLYTILNELNTNKVNIVTVEDPVEYTLKGINQVNVNTKAGLTFASGLRSILRQDPDIIMIGEIRDNETAEIAVRAAITGHLVLSTIHTNDAPSSVVRLMDMGIEPYLASTSIAGIIAQRLVKRICPKCKEAYEASEYEKKVLLGDTSKNLTLHRGRGCGYCNDTGYVGRIGVYEIMEMSRMLRDAMAMKKDIGVLRNIAKSEGMKTLAEQCMELVLDGITTFSELASITLLKEI